MEAGDQPITVVLCDDHVVVRRGLRLLLEREAGFTVVAEAGSSEEAVRAVAAERPAILVLDLNIPGEPPLAAFPGVLEAGPDTQVVVLTMEQDPAFARRALDAGARGYVLKQAVDQELVAAIRAATAGETHVSPEVARRLAEEPAEEGRPGGLSEREAEVLRLIALGHTNPEIAEALGLSVRTVETHRAHIQQKLRLSSRTELVRWALDHDLIGSGPGT